MIKLNTNYDGLLEELSRLEKYFYRRGNHNKSFACVQVYKVLHYLYYMESYQQADSFIIHKNDSILEIAATKEKQFFNQHTSNFLANKDFHRKMFGSVYFDSLDMIGDFYDSDYFDKLLSTYRRPFNIKNNEDLDVLLNFFKEIDPVVEEIFLDLLKKEKIYELNPMYNRDGLTSFNSLEKTVNMFIRKRIPYVEYLASFAHEMGHVIDDYDFVKRFSDNDHWKNIAITSYNEVISTLFQQMFYQFLIENNIRKEDAILSAIDYFYNYLMGIGDAILYSCLEDNDHFFATSKPRTREEVFELIKNTGHDVMFDELTDNKIITPFNDSVEYGYGLILANCLINDDEKFAQFMNIRRGLFDSDDLINIGITPESAQKKMIKNIEWFINK